MIIGNSWLTNLALQLAVAEETANMIADRLRERVPVTTPIPYPSTPSAPSPQNVVIRTPMIQSRRRWEQDKVVNGSFEFLKVSGVGFITDIFMHSQSDSFIVVLKVDGEEWYNNSYTELTEISVADSHLSAYQDVSTNEYFVKISGIHFTEGFSVVIGGDNVTFGDIRANYNIEVS